LPEHAGALCAFIETQDGARLSGSRRCAARAAAHDNGFEVADDLLADLRRRAGE